MLKNSIKMLQYYNKNIPIKVIYIGDNPPDLDAEIIKKPFLYEYFPLHKVYLSEIETEQLLFLDADTFIFGDINEIFNYKDCDIVACENKWVYSKDWKNQFKPINSGVMLFNNNSQKLLNKLPEYYEIIKNNEIGDWLREIGNDWCYEEFAISKLMENNINYFDKKHVFNIENPTDILKCKESLIFHSYAVQWKETFNYLKDKKKIKLYKYINDTQFNNK